MESTRLVRVKGILALVISPVSWLSSVRADTVEVETVREGVTATTALCSSTRTEVS